MHTLRKLPTARPRTANMTSKSVSTCAYCGRMICLKSIGSRYWCWRGYFCLCYDTIITMVSSSKYLLVQVNEKRLAGGVMQEVTCEYEQGGPDRRVIGSGQGARL